MSFKTSNSDTAHELRTGEAFEFDMKLTVVGHKLQVGASAPGFALEYLDPKDNLVKLRRLTDTNGKVRLLNVINSIDTPVCHAETCKWEKALPEMPENTVLYTISMDLPFALARWSAAEGAKHEFLSAHMSEEFGAEYGVLLKEWRLLQRAVFVIDENNRIAYAEYVNDQMQEPNYDKTMEAVRAALNVAA